MLETVTEEQWHAGAELAGYLTFLPLYIFLRNAVDVFAGMSLFSSFFVMLLVLVQTFPTSATDSKLG
jgi:hypothetical protein